MGTTLASGFEGQKLAGTYEEGVANGRRLEALLSSREETFRRGWSAWYRTRRLRMYEMQVFAFDVTPRLYYMGK